MIPFIARALAAAGRALVRGGAATRVTPRAVVPKPPIRITPRVKPNKLIDTTKRPTGRHLPPAPQPRIPVPPRIRPTQDVPGTNAPLDRTNTGEHRQQTGNIPSPPLEPPVTGRQGTEWAATAANLSFAAGAAQQLASDYIPKTKWTGSVSARGFKATPLRDVLHYCLAVVFGLVHQSRVGGTWIKVDCHPVENRVEVHFGNDSAVLLEPYNIKSVTAASLLDLTDRMPGVRDVGLSDAVVAGIQKFVLGAALPGAALREMVKVAADINRLLGAGGIWDMAQTDIFTGKAPASMILNQAQPYTDMRDWSVKDKRPLLTRDLSFNPEPPEIQGMDRTHYDLRSLVAQAMYDPGVLPPPPDTVIALAQQDLPNG